MFSHKVTLMHQPRSPIRFILPAILFALQAPISVKAQGSVELTAGTVLKNMAAQFEKIRDYSAEITASVNVPNVKLPTMQAKVFFKKPDKLHVEADGFAMLPRDVVGFNPASLNEEHFDAVIQGSEKVGSIDCIKVKLLAKSDTMRLQRVMLFIDADLWLIRKMSTDPSRGESAEVLFEYMLVDGRYHMPSKITLEMQTPRRLREQGKKSEDGNGMKAAATVTYRNYKVNKGLFDDLFKEKK